MVVTYKYKLIPLLSFLIAPSSSESDARENPGLEAMRMTVFSAIGVFDLAKIRGERE